VSDTKTYSEQAATAAVSRRQSSNQRLTTADQTLVCDGAGARSRRLLKHKTRAAAAAAAAVASDGAHVACSLRA